MINKEEFEKCSVKEKLDFIKKVSSLATHNAFTKDDLLLLFKAQNEIIKKMNDVEIVVNDIPLVINPCRLCVNCTGVQDDLTTHLVENCKDCCYFYGSKFKVKG